MSRSSATRRPSSSPEIVNRGVSAASAAAAKLISSDTPPHAIAKFPCRAIRDGSYTADTLSSEGFIHCSDPQQVIGVANTRFHGRDDLILLHIAASKLFAEGRYETLEGGKELFPHIYGPINLDAVVRATPFPPRPDGSFDHDQLAAVY